MELMEKARELGRALRTTETFQELERTNEQFREDEAAQQLVQAVQEAQQALQFSQQSGVQPTEEQINSFNEKKDTLQTNITVRSLMKAQDTFNEMMKEVNEAISEGMKGDESTEE